MCGIIFIVRVLCTRFMIVHKWDVGGPMTTQEKTATVTVRMPESMKNRLEELARATGRQRTYLALEAIRTYLEVEAWQVAEIRGAIQRADAGEFATDERVAAVREKFRAMSSDA